MSPEEQRLRELIAESKVEGQRLYGEYCAELERCSDLEEEFLDMQEADNETP